MHRLTNQAEQQGILSGARLDEATHQIYEKQYPVHAVTLLRLTTLWWEKFGVKLLLFCPTPVDCSVLMRSAKFFEHRLPRGIIGKTELDQAVPTYELLEVIQTNHYTGFPVFYFANH